MALTYIAGSLAINAHAQNMSRSANQTGEGAQEAMNETGEALSNVTGGIMEGAQDIVNGSG